MAAGAIIGLIGQGVSSAMAGLQAAKANAQMQGLKKRMGWEIGNLNDLANPIEKLLREGWLPNGELSRATVANRTAPLLTSLALRQQANRGQGERYGGAGFGRAADLNRASEMAKVTGHVQGSQIGRAEADRSLADMFLTLKGQEAVYHPKLPRDRLTPWANMIGEVGSGFTNAAQADLDAKAKARAEAQADGYEY